MNAPMAGQEIGPSAFYLEEFLPGMSWSSPKRTITATDINLFSALSGDFNPLYTDAIFADASPLKGRPLMAQAAFAIATGLEQRLGLKEGTGMAFLGATMEYLAPILSGDTISLFQTVKSARLSRSPGRGIAVFDIWLGNQRDEIVAEGSWNLMLKALPLGMSPRISGSVSTQQAMPFKRATRGKLRDLSKPNFRSPGALYFEDFEIGQKWRTPTRTITETDITLTCALSGDYNPVHTDVEFARSTIFGERVLQGPAASAIASGLLSRLGLFDGTLIAFLGMDWSFHVPIFAGTGVCVAAEVISARACKSTPAGIVRFSISLQSSRGEILQDGEWIMLFTAKKHWGV